MRVFVTGASGYIGQAVAKAFRAKGHTVYGLVRTQNDSRVHT
jgi:nucleoside-diphosphate-sugar epimerase